MKWEKNLPKEQKFSEHKKKIKKNENKKNSNEKIESHGMAEILSIESIVEWNVSKKSLEKNSLKFFFFS